MSAHSAAAGEPGEYDFGIVVFPRCASIGVRWGGRAAEKRSLAGTFGGVEAPLRCVRPRRSGSRQLTCHLSLLSWQVLHRTTMADTQSILSQRFLETDGELGRNFTKAFGRFHEVHAALAAAHTATAAGSSADAVATPSPAASAPELFQSLLRELASYEHGVRHCALIQANSRVEMESYQSRELEVSANITAVHASLTTLQSELERAKKRRAELEEYEAMMKRILALPSRAETKATMEKLHAVQAQMQQDRQALIADMSGKQTKYRAVVASLGQVSHDWTLAEADEAELAAREAEAERARAREEAAMAEAAMQERLEKGEEVDEPEEPEQQEKEDGEGGGGEEGKEEGEMEEGEAPPDGEGEEGKKDATYAGGDVTMDDGGARSATPAAASGANSSVPNTPVASPTLPLERSGTETPTPMEVTE
jgi:hypothetical protein